MSVEASVRGQEEPTQRRLGPHVARTPWLQGHIPRAPSLAWSPVTRPVKACLGPQEEGRATAPRRQRGPRSCQPGGARPSPDGFKPHRHSDERTTRRANMVIGGLFLLPSRTRSTARA